MRSLLVEGEDVAYTEPVLMEMLAGARSDQEWNVIRRLVMGASLLPFDPVADFEHAAWLRREARARGTTATSVDCMIIAVAQRRSARLLTRDRQQAELASLVGVEVLEG